MRICLCIVVVLLCNHNLCCEHTVLCHCRLPHRDFVAGSSADVQINLRNDSSVEVRSVSVRVSRVDLGMGVSVLRGEGEREYEGECRGVG